jgi:hypothetical protein
MKQSLIVRSTAQPDSSISKSTVESRNSLLKKSLAKLTNNQSTRRKSQKKPQQFQALPRGGIILGLSEGNDLSEIAESDLSGSEVIQCDSDNDEEINSKE